MKLKVHLDLDKNQLLNAVVHNLATAPSSPAFGQIYYNTATHRLYVYNNVGWVDLTPTITGGTSDADSMYVGFYLTSAELNTAYPTAFEGNYAVVGATDTVWIWDTDTIAWVDSGNALGAVPINSIGLLELKPEILNALFPQRVDMGASNNLDWADPNATFVKTQTANSTFTFSNLPTGTKTKTITMHLNPSTFSGSFPAYCTKIGANVIEPSVANVIVFECVNGNSGSELVYYTVNPNV